MSSAEPDPDNNNADDNRDPKSERQVWIDVQRRLRRCRHEEHTHRDQWGNCVLGGQNQDYCLATKGRPATRMPNGTWRCI